MKMVCISCKNLSAGHWLKIPRVCFCNISAKLMVIDPEIHKFKQVGWGYLYAIYDAVHKKITLTTDIRKTVAATVDVPKGMTSELLPVYA